MFGHLLQGRFPTLWRHLAALEVDAASVTLHWFLCLFLNSLPLDSTLRGELAPAGSEPTRRRRRQASCHAAASRPCQPPANHLPAVLLLPALPPVWDLLFFEGSAVVLFRMALALIEIYEQVCGLSWRGGVHGWVWVDGWAGGGARL